MLVHLPVGILLIAALFFLFIKKEKRAAMHYAIGLMLFWGMVSAVASCVSGYLLSRSDDYDTALTNRHQWFGISLVIVAAIAFYLHKKQHRALRVSLIIMLLLLAITGHLGGSITHGSDYLTAPLSGANAASAKGLQPIPNVQEAVAYNDIVKPILEAKCYSCHGPNKQKGRLRLDEPDFILKGGKEGKSVVAGKPEQSLLVERIFLPDSDEDHMPPKEKPQLTKQEMELLHWWVASGVDFNKKVKDLAATEKIKPVLQSLQTGAVKNEDKIAAVPKDEISKANEEALKALRDKGVVVLPVAANSNYLSANFVAVDKVTAADLQLLDGIKEQLVWLKLSDAGIDDAALKNLSNLSALTRLYLDDNSITDAGLQALSNLKNLQYINLSKTKVGAKGVSALKNNKNLGQVYLYQTALPAADYTTLKKTFPKTIIDTGGYKVPILEGDTTKFEKQQPNQ